MSLPSVLSDVELAQTTGAPLEVVHQCRDRGVITAAPDGLYPRLALLAVALAWAAIPVFPAGSTLPYELVRELAPRFAPALGDLQAVPERVALRYEAGPLHWEIRLPFRARLRHEAVAEL